MPAAMESGTCRRARARLWPHQKGQSWKPELASGVINHIDLASIETRLQRCEWHIQLKYRCTPIRCIEPLALDDGCFVSLCISFEECHIGQEANALLSVCQVVGRWANPFPPRIIDLVIQVKMLIRREHVCDTGHYFRAVADQWILILVFRVRSKLAG